MTVSDKILIVDDDGLILSCFERLLGKRFDLDMALGSNQGLELITTRGPYAVVLSDMRMPGMTGIQLLAKLKERSPATVGVLLTGDADAHQTQEAVRTGVVYRVVEKPCPPAELLQVLQEALARHEQNIQSQK